MAKVSPTSNGKMRSPLLKPKSFIQATVRHVKKHTLAVSLELLVIFLGLLITFVPQIHPMHQYDRVTFHAYSSLQWMCVGFSRASAFGTYVPMICVFVTKCKGLMNWIRGTPLKLYLQLDRVDEHDFHVLMGKLITVDAFVHTFFHLLRWGLQGNINLLWTHQTGITGLTCISCILLISVPMTILRDKIRYAYRKLAHYAFFPFGIALALHAPADAAFVAYVLSFCIILYTMDAIWVWLFYTENVKTTSFSVLDCGVQISMPLSAAVVNKSRSGGFVYICVPWVSKYEWHPFSVYDDPSDEKKKNVFVYKVGDWSSALHRSLQNDTSRPIWFQGPFVSPFCSAMEFDKQILVATGIGITPALCTVDALKETKIVNLLWMTHDPDLVEFYLQQHEFDQASINLIYYSGKKTLNPGIVEQAKNVRIVCGFANLHEVIPKIICDVETRKTLTKATRQIQIIPAPNVEMKEEAPVDGLMISKVDALDYMSGISRVELQTWGILYCGMCPPVQRALKQIVERYGLNYFVEGFKW